jgi:uncharacterized membrane protein YfcA
MNNTRNLLPYLMVIPLAAGVRGFSGLGSGIITMTTFSLLDTNLERVSVVLNIVFTSNTLILLYLSSRRIKIVWRQVLFISIGTAVGIPGGYQFILRYHQMPLFKFFLGIIIVSGSLYFFFPVRFRKCIPAGFGIGFGAVSGFIAGAFMSGGPPLSLYLYSQMEDPRDMKGTLQMIFIISSVVRLITIGVGKAGYSREVLLSALVVLLPAAGMLYLGHRVSEGLDLQLLRKLIYGLLGCFGAVIAVNGMAAYLSGC